MKPNLFWTGLPAAVAMCCSTAPISSSALAQSTPNVAEEGQDPNQQIHSNVDGEIAFAGHSVELEGFEGVTGYATDAAYVATFAGLARIGEHIAKPGRIILIPPYGQEPLVERFDAQRLAASMAENPAADPDMLARLEAIADRQRTGIFLGRLGKTNFNVATSGNKSREVARRSIIGGAAARTLRFAATENQEEFDRKVIEMFLNALAAGDAATVAELMDPVPFGGITSGEADKARRKMAAMVLAQRNWAAFLGDGFETSASSDEQWVTITSQGLAYISLRNAQGFTFVKSIRVEGA